MTLEGEIGGGVLLLDVLNGATALDTSNSETGSIGKAADYPRLPLKGGLHGLVEFGRVVEVHDIDVAVSRADDEKFVLDIHCVHTFLTIDIGDRGLLSQVPVFDGLVQDPVTRSGDPPTVGLGNI